MTGELCPIRSADSKMWYVTRWPKIFVAEYYYIDHILHLKQWRKLYNCKLTSAVYQNKNNSSCCKFWFTFNWCQSCLTDVNDLQGFSPTPCIVQRTVSVMSYTHFNDLIDIFLKTCDFLCLKPFHSINSVIWLKTIFEIQEMISSLVE